MRVCVRYVRRSLCLASCLPRSRRCSLIRKDAVLRRPAWSYVIVDEAQHMKNHKSKLSVILGSNIKSRHRLLLTGTPLQNNLTELWSLLNYILPAVFGVWRARMRALPALTRCWQTRT